MRHLSLKDPESNDLFGYFRMSCGSTVNMIDVSLINISMAKYLEEEEQMDLVWNQLSQTTTKAQVHKPSAVIDESGDVFYDSEHANEEEEKKSEEEPIVRKQESTNCSNNKKTTRKEQQSVTDNLRQWTSLWKGLYPSLLLCSNPFLTKPSYHLPEGDGSGATCSDERCSA